MYQREGEWEGARKVGQRLSRLEIEADVRAEVLCDVGAICRDELEDYKQISRTKEKKLQKIGIMKGSYKVATRKSTSNNPFIQLTNGWDR